MKALVGGRRVVESRFFAPSGFHFPHGRLTTTVYALGSDVSVISTATNTLVATIGVGDNPVAVVIKG
jgi:YVTN family beta-propeller protein